MAHYLDPKNDLTFKRVFGEHKHLYEFNQQYVAARTAGCGD